MKISADNGIFLGEIIWEEGDFYFKTNFEMTEYMLEQALKQFRKIKRCKK